MFVLCCVIGYCSVTADYVMCTCTSCARFINITELKNVHILLCAMQMFDESNFCLLGPLGIPKSLMLPSEYKN